MIDRDRIGIRAVAWSEAGRDAIFCHILDLEMALWLALDMLRKSAYARDMRDTFDQWETLLEAVPPVDTKLP